MRSRALRPTGLVTDSALGSRSVKRSVTKALLLANYYLCVLKIVIQHFVVKAVCLYKKLCFGIKLKNIKNYKSTLWTTTSKPGMWKRSFFYGSRSAKILPLPLPHRLFDLRVTWPKSFVHFLMWIKRWSYTISLNERAISVARENKKKYN